MIHYTRNDAFKCIVTKLIGAMCIKNNANDFYHFPPDIDTRAMPLMPLISLSYAVYDFSLLNWIRFTYANKPIHLNDPDLGSLVSIHTIHNILYKKDTMQLGYGQLSMRCPLVEWCKKSFISQGLPDLTSDNDYCIHSPWDNITEPQRLDQCSFGRIWAAWRMNLKKIQVRLTP